MKKFLCMLVAVMMLALPLMASAEGAVTLRMGSWRADDVEQWNAILAQYKELTGVEIVFEPTIADQYNSTLSLQLENGTGPDLMFARSYQTGAELYNAGYFGNCSDIAGLANFLPGNLTAWQTADGTQFAVPIAAVSHAVYYNKDLFEANNVAIPTTWDEFIAACEVFKNAGITAIGNGIADQWDVLECLFLQIVANDVGGAESRVLYETGEKPLNDEAFVSAYTDLAALVPYLNENFKSMTYNDAANLFALGQCAMYLDGSWTAGTFGDVDFQWGVFSLPAHEANKNVVVFHPDAAITYNTASPYAAEAKAFLEWVTSIEGAKVLGANLPTGFFPMVEGLTLDNEIANQFLALNVDHAQDARFIWPALMDAYNPMMYAAIDVLTGAKTPQEAADSVVTELAK